MIKQFVIVISIVLTFAARGQVQHDLESWSGLKIDVELLKKLEFKMDGQIRFDQNISRHRSSLFEIGIGYKPFKWLMLTPAYRITRTGDVNNDFGRANMDITFDTDIGKDFKIKNRTRGQYAYFYNRVGSEIELRNKTQLDYNLSKLFDPFTSIEFFYSEETISDFRLRLGGNWRINKEIDLRTFYAMESQMGRKTNDKEHIVGIILKINVNAKKKKKK
ncbi:MAG: hypothetical protein COA32_07690 [Fluviicola sp.]|nr:MAG: hypothetical protein COA32_07690 [Fluviicola sp.]